MTPKTESMAHYFGFSARDFRLDDAALDKIQLSSDSRIRQQDSGAINAVEHRVEFGAGLQREKLGRSDALAIKLRRKIQAIVDAEAVPA